MSGRGKYKALVKVWTERTMLKPHVWYTIVEADGYDDAEHKAKMEAINMVGGYDPEVLWILEVADSDWPIDRADD